MICNKREFANLVGYDINSVTNWMAAGMPHTTEGRRGGKVEIDTAQAIKWLMDVELERKFKKLGGKNMEVKNLKDGISREQLRKLKIENDLKDGQTVLLADVAEFFNNVIVTLASLLDGAAGKMASGDSVLRQRLLDEHRRIRELFANKLKTYTTRPESVETDDASAEKISVEVGAGEADTPGWLR